MAKDEVEFRLVQGQNVIVKNREMFRIGDFVNNGSFGKMLKKYTLTFWRIKNIKIQFFQLLGKSVIHRAHHLEKNIPVIIKFEKSAATENRNPQLKQERNIYVHMEVNGANNIPEGIPKFYRFAINVPLQWYRPSEKCAKHKIENFNILAVEELGTDLATLVKRVGGPLSASSVLNIGWQMFQILKDLHARDVIHRDIKLGNFIMGKNESKSILYLVDFGLARLYRNEKDGYQKFVHKKHVLGTKKYLSTNALNYLTPDRRDDLTSVCYLLLELALGELPWSTKTFYEKCPHLLVGTREQQKLEMQKWAKDTKKLFSAAKFQREYSESLAKFSELTNILCYCESLQFGQDPDYALIGQLLQKMMKENVTELMPLGFDWDTEENEQIY